MTFFDPTLRVEPVNGAPAVASSSGSKKITATYRGQEIECLVAGPAVEIGDAVSLVRASGIYWAIRREEDVTYSNGYARPLYTWKDIAPNCMALRYLMRDNPKTFRYQTATVSGVVDGIATATILGTEVLAPVVWGQEIVDVAAGPALAVKVSGKWYIIGTASDVWSWSYTNTRTYQTTGDYTGVTEWYDDYTYTHSEQDAVLISLRSSLRDGDTAVDPPVRKAIGESYTISGAIKTTAAQTQVATKRRRYNVILDPNALYEFIASHYSWEPEPPEVQAKRDELIAYYIAYPVEIADSTLFAGPNLPADGWAPAHVFISKETVATNPSTGLPGRYYEWSMQKCDVYAAVPAIWTFTENTEARLEGVYE